MSAEKNERKDGNFCRLLKHSGIQQIPVSRRTQKGDLLGSTNVILQSCKRSNYKKLDCLSTGARQTHTVTGWPLEQLHKVVVNSHHRPF